MYPSYIRQDTKSSSKQRKYHHRRTNGVDKNRSPFESTIGCAEILQELHTIPVRPASEEVIKALYQVSMELRPSALKRDSILPELWQQVLAEWTRQLSLSPTSLKPEDVEDMTGTFVHRVLSETLQQQRDQRAAAELQNQQEQQLRRLAAQQQRQRELLQEQELLREAARQMEQQRMVLLKQKQDQQELQTQQERLRLQELQRQQQQQQQQQQQRLLQPQPQQQHMVALSRSASSHQTYQSSSNSTSKPVRPSSTPAGINHINGSQSTTAAAISGASASATTAAASSTSSSGSRPATPNAAIKDEPFSKQFAHLLTDTRRFHAPIAVLERVYGFFRGAPQLDPTSYEDSPLNSPITIPFPEIMDNDAWVVSIPPPVGEKDSSARSTVQPIQSCFMHVPILPSKRRFETDTEVILLDDVRLAGQLNAKLWEEFSSGNVLEAISIVPTSARWFGQSNLADWPCVVMAGQKFEQANGGDPQSGKKYSEIHSYIAVYLGRDPMRQSQFVQLFQDLGISSLQVPEGTQPTTSSQSSRTNNGATTDSHGHHRWIAGFRRLFRPQAIPGLSSGAAGSGFGGGGGGGGGGAKEVWDPSDDEADQEGIDPQFDDIYSILPPNKKPRLDRAGRPTDATAANHHVKRRKMEEKNGGTGFSKLKDSNALDKKWGSDAEMSE
ncbi:hypothetical protein BGZ83_002152 [Gryganskiella cystojenkinii]|nr:hypothetical protein BGZ83_002152 [Gryganskiella cystojenkinii]